MDSKPVTWAELIDLCSRTLTTRTRTVAFYGASHITDGAQKLDVILPDGRRATVVPTRMHYPGFYVRARGCVCYWQLRNPEQLVTFQNWVDAGSVRRG